MESLRSKICYEKFDCAIAEDDWLKVQDCHLETKLSFRVREGMEETCVTLSISDTIKLQQLLEKFIKAVTK